MLQVGKISSGHGLHGALLLVHEMPETEWLKSGDALLIEQHPGSYIPYFVSSVKDFREGTLLVHLEDIDTPEQSRAITGKNVFLREADLSGAVQDTPQLWKGFSLVDRTLGVIGPIKEVMRSGQQWLGTVDYRDQERLIPLSKELIVEVNPRNRYLRMQLPEGLLDI